MNNEEPTTLPRHQTLLVSARLFLPQTRFVVLGQILSLLDNFSPPSDNSCRRRTWSVVYGHIFLAPRTRFVRLGHDLSANTGWSEEQL